jgi:hypothetical protein
MKIVGAALAAALAAAPQAAWACPACAGRDAYGPGAVALFAAFLVLPFGLFALVWRIVRRLEQRPR